ncbi:uncharacterized protein Z520_11268 [Fonsecaea multimorphosa CBS 102226]|uniref:Cytochrome P450 monooxygenase n=1 Tax=Fonsecaea multimorphosa CBS 102226 TaxID=1442371 RepID=A0A0D2GU24_9EURO|nr:uncharacterized protein Z520_11268 [Fonsecaea multimorphosa CBS 102226]KIX92995.1 hypothetical protein Z520_11268 [Fonsecaea multimorphosa CBS 102226]OAL18243.1 hypothetical protein AYO22_10821 [Fonsecaea multimorphosa]
MSHHWINSVKANIESSSPYRYGRENFGAIIFLAIFVWLSAKAVYNIYIHPLSGVPGPWVAKVLESYLVPAIATFKRSHKLLDLHRQYGGVVRVGVNQVSISDWTALKTIYTNKTSTKSELLYSTATFTGFHENIFSMRNKEAHHARRKLQNQSYSQQVVLRNEELLSEKANILVQRMIQGSRDSGSGYTVEVFRLNALFSLEVLMKCAFNRDYSEAPDKESLELLTSLEESGIALATRSALPFLDRHYAHLIPGPVGQSFKQLNRFITRVLELQDKFIRHELESDAASARFLLTPLLSHSDFHLGRKLNHDEVLEEAVALVFAGSGTTSTLLSYLLWCLAKHEDVQDRLRAELQGAGSSLSEIQQLPVLNAAIKETHRLYPSFMGMVPRTLDCPIVVGKHVLPKGTLVVMQNFVHQRDPFLFPDPDSWLPDRWLHETKDMSSALTPFSLGPGNCIGQNLAKAELYLATSKIIRTVKIRLSSEMVESDMHMEDRGFTQPRKKRLLLDLDVLN